MQTELPGLSHQKRLGYRTNQEEVEFLFDLINKTIFNNELPKPEIKVVPRCRKYWGMCIGHHIMLPQTTSYCTIKMMDKWFCKQWLITTLAHEMCHQYQWDILGNKRESEGKERLMSHGPSFFIFKEKLEKNGISLKRYHGQRRWFKTRNLFKS